MDTQSLCMHQPYVLRPASTLGAASMGGTSRRPVAMVTGIGRGHCGSMDPWQLAALLQRDLGRTLVIDSRTFSEYNASHVLGSVNVCCSKLVKRRLQQDKMAVAELLQPGGKVKLDLEGKREVVVYDQSTQDTSLLLKDSFVSVLLAKLEGTFLSVSLLTGGFAAFSSCFPGLCEGKPPPTILPMSISQPCLPVANVGPTRILPHLYLGSQKDVLNKDLMAQNSITYVLNASNTCPKPDFICESHFMRVPVNDSYCEKLLPWLEKTNDFIDKAKVSNCRVIVHCLAGISRSATIAIAYIMKTMGLSSDDAYRFVKDRRPSISPNFNFLGQLLEFEKGLKLLKALSSVPGKVLTELESETRPWESTSRTTFTENAPGSQESKSNESESKPHSPASLQQGLSGLHLSSEHVLEVSRLKRTFSLNIKSAYTSGTCSRTESSTVVVPVNEDDVPELCKLDSPGAAGRLCSLSPLLSGPASAEPASGGKIWSQQRRKGKGVNGCTEGSAVPPLSLNVGRSAAVHKSPGLEGGVKASLLLSLPGLSNMGPSQIWTKHKESAQAGTPGTPMGERPWCFSPDSPACSGNMRFSGGSAYMAFTCGGRAGSNEAVRLRDKPHPHRDSRSSWHEDAPGGTADGQFKRRSCQMEFEEGITETRACEELGKIGKQSSFSGSMEVIGVS